MDDVIPLNEIGKIETVTVYNQAYVDKQQKRIAELEEKISILLSCKNCLENKGGLLCQKEYEDKCLAQKIQYIKELKEEIADLKEQDNKAKEIIRQLCLMVRELNNPNVQLTDVDYSLSEAEQFLKENK